MSELLVLRTSFLHHSPDSGYKKILDHIHPKYVMGIDETTSGNKSSLYKLKCSYKWLFEVEAWWKYRKEIELVHVMYGEDYFRLSTHLFKQPVVVTFHQPSEILEDELKYGNMTGRVSRILHLLTKNRFKKVSAVIATENSQAQVLKKFFDPVKVFLIPLGVSLEKFMAYKNTHQKTRRKNVVITVGNWQRDWESYFKVVEHAKEALPNVNFILVNRKLSATYKEKAQLLPNVTYIDSVDDQGLFDLYMQATFQFMPLKGAAGNNSLMESLAFACPVMMTNVIGADFPILGPHIKLVDKKEPPEIIKQMKSFINYIPNNMDVLEKSAYNSISAYDWSETAKKTIDVYKYVLNQNK